MCPVRRSVTPVLNDRVSPVPTSRVQYHDYEESARRLRRMCAPHTTMFTDEFYEQALACPVTLRTENQCLVIYTRLRKTTAKSSRARLWRKIVCMLATAELRRMRAAASLMCYMVQ